MTISLHSALGWLFLPAIATAATCVASAAPTYGETSVAVAAPMATLTAAAKPSANISAEGIRHLVDQLDSDGFAARDFAAQRLFEIGRPAITPLSQAARGTSLEQSTAAVGILRRLMKSDDAATKQSAHSALAEIAKNGANTAANLAAAALRPPAESQPNIYAPWVFRGGFPGNRRVRRRVMIAGGQPVVVVGPMQPANPPRANPPAQAVQPAPQKPAK